MSEHSFLLPSGRLLQGRGNPGTVPSPPRPPLAPPASGTSEAGLPPARSSPQSQTVSGSQLTGCVPLRFDLEPRFPFSVSFPLELNLTSDFTCCTPIPPPPGKELCWLSILGATPHEDQDQEGGKLQPSFSAERTCRLGSAWGPAQQPGTATSMELLCSIAASIKPSPPFLLLSQPWAQASTETWT